MSSSDFEGTSIQDGARGIFARRYSGFDARCLTASRGSRRFRTEMIGGLIAGSFGWLRNRTMFAQIVIPLVCSSVVAIASLVWSFTSVEMKISTGMFVFGLPLAQIFFSFVVVFLAAKGASRTLRDLSDAAAQISISTRRVAVQERGPRELRALSRAFNAMGVRVEGYVDDRMQMLTAFAHDMQTPITRMRLRAELSDDFPDREKVLRDLSEMERLVREGITYAKNSLYRVEDEVLVDLRAFIESIVFDYQDTGRAVRLCANVDGAVILRPMTLRRIISNLVDNSLKYARDTEVCAYRGRRGDIVIEILDRGPGIEPSMLQAATQPFVKLKEGAGGIGLGLAIAQQLAQDVGAELRICNRPGGGLRAEITLGVRSPRRGFNRRETKR